MIAQHRVENPDFSEVEAVASERGVKVTPVQADFSDPQSVFCLLAHVRMRWVGIPSTLLCSTQVLVRREPSRSSMERLCAVCCRSIRLPPYELAAGLVPLMSAPGGRYIFTGSVLTRYAFPAMTGYGMSKIALEYLVRNMAVELGPQGITVNLVAPGVVDTDINAPGCAIMRRQPNS